MGWETWRVNLEGRESVRWASQSSPDVVEDNEKEQVWIRNWSESVTAAKLSHLGFF